MDLTARLVMLDTALLELQVTVMPNVPMENCKGPLGLWDDFHTLGFLEARFRTIMLSSVAN